MLGEYANLDSSRRFRTLIYTGGPDKHLGPFFTRPELSVPESDPLNSAFCAHKATRFMPKTPAIATGEQGLCSTQWATF